jgi:mersacidin/lichenicidin family type 2 lantibiotic
MNGVDVIRAWKDEAYRASLTDSQRSTLPENPAGLVEVNAPELEGSVGGNAVLPGLAAGLGPLTYRPCPTQIRCPRRTRPCVGTYRPCPSLQCR